MPSELERTKQRLIEVEASLHACQARLRFMNELDEALTDARDASAAMVAATELLAKHLRASRTAYADVDADTDRFFIRDDYSAPGVSSSAGTYSLDLFGSRAAADMRAGRTLVIRDVAKELAPADGPDMFLSIQIAAIVCCPLVKDGKLVAMMAVHQIEPRDWHSDEIGLVETVVERCWAHVQRVGSENRLRISEARYRTLFEVIDAGFCIVEVDLAASGDQVDYRVLEANPAFFRHTGFLQEILGRSLREAAPELEEHWYEIYGRVARTGEAERFEQGSDMLGRWFDVYAFPTGKNGENLVAILFNDITARRNAELALLELNNTLERRIADAVAQRRQADELYRAYFENSPEALFVVGVGDDGSFTVEEVNPAHEAGVGLKLDDIRGKRLDEILPSEVAARVIQSYEHVVSSGAIYQYREVFDLGGEPQHWDTSLVPVRKGGGRVARIIGSSRNVSRQVAAEEALRQSQKMEAMGQLTGGVAHDFNNLLTPIVGSLDMLQRSRLGGSREQRLIAGAMQSAERAKTLVQRLLAFARRQPLQAVPVDVAALMSDMGELIASTTGPQITVSVESSEDLRPALADPNQVEMALLNLAVNARDAMPNGGTLRISARNQEIAAAHPAGLRPGRYICLSVADTGVGMDDVTLARAVEPFFSTKGVGKGTGLGLSMVHGLASQLGGGLSIQSRLGLGTNVELYIPESSEAPSTAQGPADLVRSEHRGTALLVDDEELVRMSTADMLHDLGYSVLEAGSAEEALRLMRSGKTFDLLVTDHLMPGMCGADLAREVMASKPAVPILLISGYAEAEGVAVDLPRLTKPFRKDELARGLSQILSQKG